jgi:hypothetical protein
MLRALIVVAAIGAAVLPASGDVGVRGSLDHGTIAVGASAVLTITIEGSGSSGGQPRIEVPEGLRIRDAGTSRSFSMVNGRFSQTIELRYVVVGLREGDYTIGPIEVEVSGRAHSVGPFELKVVQGQPPPDRPASPGTRSTDQRSPPPLMVEMRVEPERAFVGQQVVLRTTFWSRSDIQVVDARFIPPETEGFWKEELPPERRSWKSRGGARYEVTEIAVALFPTRDGELTITPARVAVRYREPRRRTRDPFSMFRLGGREREAEPSAAPVTVRVDPLPAGAPAGFGGAVGEYRIRAETDLDKAVQGEPVSWTVEISGAGNVAALEAPAFPEIPGTRSFDGGSEVDIARKDDRLGGKKSFSRVLVPESAGTITLPALTWAFFNPGEQRYKSRSVPSRQLEVVAAEEVGGVGRGRVGGAIRGVRHDARLAPLDASRPWRLRSFWAWQLIPILALLAGIAWNRRREMQERDPVGTRLRQAPRKLRRELRAVTQEVEDPWGRLAQAIESFLADRFGTETRGMTREALCAWIAERSGETESAEELTAILERADSLRFRPDLGKEKENLEEAIRRVAVLGGLLAGRRRRA